MSRISSPPRSGSDRLAVGDAPEVADSERAMVPNPPPLEAPVARDGAKTDNKPHHKEKNS